MNFDYLLRRLIGRSTCVMGTGTKLTSTAKIRNIRGNNRWIRVGENTIVAGELLVFSHGGEISVGNWCYIGEGARIWSSVSIYVGNRVLISHNVNIFDSLTHPLNPRKRHAQFRAIVQSGHPHSIDLGEQSVNIGDDVWIGANAIILRGISLGEGAIIGAGAVVTTDIPPFTIAAGNPAVIIREIGADERG